MSPPRQADPGCAWFMSGCYGIALSALARLLALAAASFPRRAAQIGSARPASLSAGVT